MTMAGTDSDPTAGPLVRNLKPRKTAMLRALVLSAAALCVLSLTGCGDCRGESKACSSGCAKACCHKDGACSEGGGNAESPKDTKTCPPGCTKPCCAKS